MSLLAAIETKRDGGTLSSDVIATFVRDLVAGRVPDYQAAALLMAIWFRGLDDPETAALTDAMVASGRRLDLSAIPGSKVDKHSTGGVGDKISLILAPAAAACGARVPMISGRALGHTGGTLDKLETIPGFRTALALDELTAQVARLNVAFGAATADLAPADRILYQLRDVTGTVSSLSLICSSIVSKKVAEGIGGLVLDVKQGGGAFLADPAQARALAQAMVATGERLGVKTVAWLTDMSAPLGRAIGNALEVEEAIGVLRGGGPDDLVDLTCALGGEMLLLAGLAQDETDAREQIRAALADGRALDKFRAVVVAQGGDLDAVDDLEKLPRAKASRLVPAPRSGFVAAIDARRLGYLSNSLGAGRERRDDAIAPGAGLVVRARVGESVEAGEPLIELLFDDPARAAPVAALAADAFILADAPPPPRPLLIERIAAS